MYQGIPPHLTQKLAMLYSFTVENSLITHYNTMPQP